MADPVSAAIGVGGSLLSGALGSSASRSAARSQQQAADAATAEQRRQYDLSRQDLAPYRQIGGQALNQLGSLYGFTPYTEPSQTQPTGLNYGNLPGIGPAAARIRGTDVLTGGPFGGFGDAVWNRNQPTGARPVNPNAPAQPQGMAGFFASPDYNFRRTEGLRGIEQGAAARGGALSGNALRAVTGFSSDLASTEYGNYYNRLASLAGVGQSATNTGVQLGQNYANNVGNNMMAAGAARASGTMGAANSWGNAINSGLNLYGMYRGWGAPSSGSGGGGWGMGGSR